MNDWKKGKLIKFIIKEYPGVEIESGSRHDKVRDEDSRVVITTIPRHSKVKGPTAWTILKALRDHYKDSNT